MAEGHEACGGKDDHRASQVETGAGVGAPGDMKTCPGGGEEKQGRRNADRRGDQIAD
ncbi:MAG: hypothetical protein AAF360_15500 [Pseudomonadota bacterium]